MYIDEAHTLLLKANRCNFVFKFKFCHPKYMVDVKAKLWTQHVPEYLRNTLYFFLFIGLNFVFVEYRAIFKRKDELALHPRLDLGLVVLTRLSRACLATAHLKPYNKLFCSCRVEVTHDFEFFVYAEELVEKAVYISC